ncbi:3-ketoacyl-(acyl-carrier-protein) reductase [Bacillus sp. SG-1]|nr:3-ketoacyl-(acyl-carrier-protein) reductase [Bacillus sp. SG-1]
MPAGILISLVVGAVSVMARKWKWWWYEKLHTRIPGITPFIGPFFIGGY